MTKTPGESLESSSSERTPKTGPLHPPAYCRPGVALMIAAIAYAVAAVLLIAFPFVQSLAERAPSWAGYVIDVTVLLAPLLIAVLVAGRVAAEGIGRATGVRHWRWFDPLLGIFVALDVRAIVELVDPTAGDLFGPFEQEITPELVAGVVFLVVGLVLVSPIVEELFFRGLMMRALDDALHDAGRLLRPLVALLVSTGTFMLLHMLPFTGGVSLGLVIGTFGVGLGCGILTVATGRLGAAIIAHVTFNGVGVLLLML
jgi:membrane protease YdiL (CAAX protease family)